MNHNFIMSTTKFVEKYIFVLKLFKFYHHFLLDWGNKKIIKNILRGNFHCYTKRKKIIAMYGKKTTKEFKFDSLHKNSLCFNRSAKWCFLPSICLWTKTKKNYVVTSPCNPSERSQTEPSSRVKKTQIPHFINLPKLHRQYTIQSDVTLILAALIKHSTWSMSTSNDVEELAYVAS